MVLYYTKEAMKLIFQRYKRLMDARAECRVCGSACEICYRLATAKQSALEIKYIIPPLCDKCKDQKGDLCLQCRLNGYVKAEAGDAVFRITGHGGGGGGKSWEDTQ